ncbi:5'-3' exonuclease [Bacillus sp. J14TS2]|uniref:5'-3' exonuclease n=1 Tax=Bacillus sp. J14TS2 TaxID=2807188 RepID=UPI001B1D73AD|nr:5'-3' exonuclease [Bacillus sp. J14TS2]GIN70112.1 5'-3' exonuclease [Bacillus sp. J14TS2]
MKHHLLLVDGMALLFRAFYATAVRRNFMVNSQGVPTNAVQGYLKHLLAAVDHVQPTHIAICWDMGSVTFRNEMYTEYKANRQAPPVEMVPQFDLAKDVTTALGILNIGVKGYEADDCIGTLCHELKQDEELVLTVLTGDRDLLQIVDDKVTVLLLQKGIGNYLHYSRDAYVDEFQLEPKQLIDVKALMGDPSDGYPGVKGIGEKTAYKLMREYETIEGLFTNLALLTPTIRKKLEQDEEMLYLSRKLATIHCQVPLDFYIDQAKWQIHPTKTMNVIEQYELKSVRNALLKLNQTTTQTSLPL